jgi:hypothetical protein
MSGRRPAWRYISRLHEDHVRIFLSIETIQLLTLLSHASDGPIEYEYRYPSEEV